MSIKADDILSQGVKWNTTYTKAITDKCIDTGVNSSKEEAKNSTETYLSGKAADEANKCIDEAAKSSSDYAKGTVHQIVDATASSLKSLSNWFSN